MKRLKKFLVLMMCVGVLCGMTACGSEEKTEDNMTNTTDKDRVNDATSGKDNKDAKDKDGDGVVDDVVDDVTDGVDKAADDLTDNNGMNEDLDNSNVDNNNVDNNNVDDNTTNNQ